MTFDNKQARPRSPQAIAKLPNRQLAELIAVLEADLFANMANAQHPEQILRFRLASIRRAVTPLTRLHWCYVELLRRADVGLLATGEASS